MTSKFKEQGRRQPSLLTRGNQRENEPWGDLLSGKAPLITRVYIQNVNGLSIDRRGGQLNDICEVIRETQADIFCGQEHNLDVTQMRIRSILYDTVRQHWDRTRFIAGTTPIPFATHYKPGGTFLLTIGNVSGRIVNQVQDRWGRWVIQEFSGRAGIKLIIVSAYQPVDRRGHEGNLTVASQHRSLLLQTQDALNNPRSAFRRDLLETLRTYKKAGSDILLVGDFNEPFGSDHDGLSFIAAELQLVNLGNYRHSSKVPATYARGSRCLDYALGSARVRDALISMGYESFNARLSSDHRGYFLDFDTQKLFGSLTPDLATSARRMLKANNPHQVTAYINKMYELLQEHNAFARGKRLTFLGNRHQFAERLDRDLLAASLAAEASIPQFGEHAWSAELSMARRRVQYLKKCLSITKSGLDLTQIQQEYAPEFPDDNIPNNKEQCSCCLRLANREVHRIIKQSFVTRDTERRQRIQELEKSIRVSDQQTAKRLRRIKKAEDIKAVTTKLRNVRGKHHRSGIVRLEIPLCNEDDPATCTQWTQIDVPSEIVRLLQERNRRHFGQAHGTPFTIPPLAELLGYTGIGEAQQQFLHGTFDVTGYDESVKLLIRHLQYSHEWSRDLIRPTISDDDFCEKLRLWSESTTTSPSGMHLGHYKALISRHSFSSDAPDEDLTPEFIASRDELNYRQQALRQLRLDMINYALERGYSLQRWQKVVNTMLFKDPDNVRLHRTRVIHIYEADFNLFLGIKWRAAMHQAEDLRLLNEGQFGSRPYRNATDPVFIEELQLEISRATRKPVVLTNYDATACYDRIIPNLGMTVSQKYGVPAEVTESNASTLEKAEFHVRTELGISPTSYRHEPEFPVYGTGQGSANSPAIWCFLSSTLFDCYDTRAHQAIYWDTHNDVRVHFGLIGFVDDCNGQTNAFGSDGSTATVHQIVSQAQANAQCWSDLLHASGGALELSKCSTHILQWQFSLSGAPVLVPMHSCPEVSMEVWDRQADSEKTLQVLPAYKAHKTLGHYKDPAGTQREQYRQLKKKSDAITAFMWETPLSRLEAWTFYFACYLPAVSYPLANSSLTKLDLERVQRKAMSIIVPRCGFNRNTKKAILYGPLALGGANFRSLYVQQGVSQVMMFIRHWRKQSLTGRLLRIAVSWFQAQVGVSFSILENVHSALPQLESKWLSSLRLFLANIEAKLRLDETYLPALQRLHDFCIMDAVIASGRFTPKEICRINYCRLFLQATTVSDLTSMNGRTLDHNKLSGRHSLLSSFTHGTSIYQERPSESTWKLWSKANTLWSRSDGTLIQPLGDWIIPIHQMHQRHPAYWFAGHLWVRLQEQTYGKCTPTSSDRCFRETRTYCEWSSLPPLAVPMLALQSKPEYWTIAHQTHILEINRPPFAGTFTQFVASLPAWELELLHHVEMEEDPFSVALALEHGIRAVSDGSDWDQIQGSFGWAMSTDLGERCAKGMGPARSASPHAYRSESYGLLSLLCFLRRLAEFTGKHDPWFGIVATDSQSLIDTITQKRPPSTQRLSDIFSQDDKAVIKSFPLDPTIPEWDIIRGIQVLLQEMPEITIQHVKGHQDRDIPYRNLSLLAQLNVDADAQASRYQQELGSFQPDVLLTEWAGVHLDLPTGTVTSHYETALRYHATAPALQSHMQERFSWTPQIMATINWDAHGRALRRHLDKRTHLVKLVHEILPTNSKLHRNNPRRNKCPCCPNIENWQHILRCQSAAYASWRTKFLQTVEHRCNELNTMPRLKALLMTVLHTWITFSPDEAAQFQHDPSGHPSSIRRLVFQQNAIGWDHIFLGRFSMEWSSIQDEYYARQAHSIETKRLTGARWQVAIISTLWQQWFLLWEVRNKALHGDDARSRAQADRKMVERTLTDIYDLRNQMEPSVQSLLHRDISAHFSKTTA
ncbi:hypothetical protein MHU86_8050 [Fragilaria crotonensis]|nr:hypothetical protein MHU86_8050 [Fragilaria crotonensis]